MIEYEFTVVIERDEDGRFLARDLIRDAIRLHIEDRLGTGEPIYQEVGATKVRVAV